MPSVACPPEVDAAVVGGGLFGAWLARTLARRHGASVALVEREGELCARASYKNQARVHNGYHYPRSILTGLRSRVNSARFLTEYADCIDTGFTMLYAVARARSNVTAAQFRAFCERIEAPLRPAGSAERALFDAERIEDVWIAEEWAFDATKLAARLAQELSDARVPVLLRHEAERVARGPGGLLLAARSLADGGARTIAAKRVFNCTYSSLNTLPARSGLPRLALKQELAEIALVRVPRAFERLGVTVMCGPFFSCMPFPARGLHSLSHVRYTPHLAFHDRELLRENEDVLAELHPRTRVLAMQKDAARYLPIAAAFEPVESLFELKTVLPASEQDDSRPILFHAHAELPGLVSVLGAKIDNVYDLEPELARLFAQDAAA